MMVGTHMTMRRPGAPPYLVAWSFYIFQSLGYDLSNFSFAVSLCIRARLLVVP